MYKIQWKHYTKEEATWETEKYISNHFPGFLPSQASKFFSPLLLTFESRDEILFKGGRL